MLTPIKKLYIVYKGILNSCSQFNSSTAELLHKIGLRCSAIQPLDSTISSLLTSALALSILNKCATKLMSFSPSYLGIAVALILLGLTSGFMCLLYFSLCNLYYSVCCTAAETIMALCQCIFDIRICKTPYTQVIQFFETYNDIHSNYLYRDLDEQFLTKDAGFYEISDNLSEADIAKLINRYATFLETKGMTFDNYQCPISHTILSEPVQVDVNVQTQQGSKTNSIYFNKQNIKKYVMAEKQKHTIRRTRQPVNCPMRRTPITNTSFTIDTKKQLQVFKHVCWYMKQESNRTSFLSNTQ